MTAAQPDRPDGRATRWTHHREQRRVELTEAALRAVRRHGAGVGMDEIATEAGTSKTVIYRHFGDRLGLYLSVCASVDARIRGDIRRVLDAPGPQPHGETADRFAQDPRGVIEAVIDSYLAQVEHDPEVYRFVVTRPPQAVASQTDPVAGISDTIASVVQPIFAAALRERGRPDDDAARIWAHGLIGFVRESADRWLTQVDRPPRHVVVRHLADFANVGLLGVLHPERTDDHLPAGTPVQGVASP